MSLQDKAKLLFADRNKKADTAGLERLLTPEEEEAIIKDAQKNNQIAELNRLSRLFNVASLLTLDIQTAYLSFSSALWKLHGIIMAMSVKSRADDIIGQMIYDLATSKEKDEKKRDELSKELEKKYRNTEVFKMYDHFTPAYSLDEPKVKTAPEPNIYLQLTFINAVERLKDFRRIIYQLNYVVKLAGIDFLGDKEKKKIKEYEKELEDFIKLDGLLGVIRLYRAFADKKLMRTANLTQPTFLDVIKDIEKAIQLTHEEIQKAEAQIEGVLAKADF